MHPVSAHRPRQHMSHIELLQYRHMLCHVRQCVIAKPCASHDASKAHYARLLTSPTHVPCSNDMLPSCAVPCASSPSQVRAMMHQRHQLSAHRPLQHMCHAAMIHHRRLALYHVKGTLCLPIDLANTCTMQQCYNVVGCCAMWEWPGDVQALVHQRHHLSAHRLR